MVLKDKRIIEQGSHMEFRELNGLFAPRWADQIKTFKDPKATAKYDLDDDAFVIDIPESETRSTAIEERIAVDSSQVVPESLQAKPPTSFTIFDDPFLTFLTTISSSDTPSTDSHPECSAILRMFNVRVWVVTKDKKKRKSFI